MEVSKTLGLPQRGTARVLARQREIHKPVKAARRKEGHDALIEALSQRAMIVINLLNGALVCGLLKESDRFTITVIENYDTANPQQRIIFKHAIESFTLKKLNG